MKSALRALQIASSRHQKTIGLRASGSSARCAKIRPGKMAVQQMMIAVIAIIAAAIPSARRAISERRLPAAHHIDQRRASGACLPEDRHRYAKAGKNDDRTIRASDLRRARQSG